jgi:hypothetical protein
MCQLLPRMDDFVLMLLNEDLIVIPEGNQLFKNWGVLGVHSHVIFIAKGVA